MVIIKCKVIFCIVFYLCFPYTSSINMSSGKFLGIKVKNNTEDINKLIVKGLEDLLKDNTINNSTFIQLYDELKSNSQISEYRYPKDFHVTIVFEPEHYMNESAVKRFEEGKEIDVIIKGFVFISKKILTFFVEVNTSILNPFPHITTLLGEDYKAKNSNDILESVFKDRSKKTQSQTDSVSIFNNIKVREKHETVYLVRFKNNLFFKGVMKSYPKNPK